MNQTSLNFVAINNAISRIKMEPLKILPYNTLDLKGPMCFCLFGQKKKEKKRKEKKDG